MTRTPFTLALAAFAAGCLLHADRMPVWCTAAALGACLWRFWLLHTGRALPRRAVRLALTAALTIAVIATAREGFGLASGTTLLAAMGAAKLTETTHRRDAAAVASVALFLLLAALLDRQTLARLPLYAGTLWLVTASLASLAGRRESEQARHALRTAASALAWALPLSAVAFVLLPRLPGGLWGLPGQHRAMSGLSDEMSPGSITDLSLSDAIAFRVVFDGPPPPPEERYWRGPVLHAFDGYTWRRSRAFAPSQPEEPLGAPLRYRVILEPHGQTWWPALDRVEATPAPRVRLTFDHQLVSFRPVTAVATYAASSHTRWRSPAPLSLLARRLDSQLPPGRNPRAQALARELAAAHPDPRALSDAILERFRAERFQYTLTPPRLDLDSVDDFLFRTRLGFCGHFASAHATLMRAAGVPARVVTGYHGGEWNPLGGYLIVRQSDAHAWVEIWVDGEGWQRVDPTAAAAPERLRRGILDLIPQAGTAASRLLRETRWLADALRAWDAANTWWQRRVVDYDRDSQRALLDRLGMAGAGARALGLMLMAGALFWAVIAMWRIGRARPPRGGAVERAWRHLLKVLAGHGVPMDPHLAPHARIDRAVEAVPELTHPLRTVLAEYLALRFGPPDRSRQANRARMRAFAASVRRLEWRLRLRRREQALPPMPEAQRRWLRELVPQHAAAPAWLRERVERLAWALQRRVEFVGCDGLVVDDRIRAVISFQACLLVATRDLSLYRSLRSVLVYPDAFVVEESEQDESGVVTEGSRELSGQSVDDSRVLVSWRDVEEGLAAADGYNVVLHEFAHFLDHLAEGALSADGGSEFQQRLSAEYRLLCEAVDAGEDTLIDPYGAEDPAEFFAVCTETLFELPVELQARHPELHAALAAFYGLDPVSWSWEPAVPAPAAAAAPPRRTAP